jgi:hypothetical protein
MPMKLMDINIRKVFIEFVEDGWNVRELEYLQYKLKKYLEYTGAY